MKRVISILLFLIFFVSHPVHAVDFIADYDIDYAVSPAGNTIVTQKISLTNEKTNLYPKKYTVTIDSEQIKNVIAYDNKGMISPSVKKNDGKTEIELSFNDQIVGMGKTLPFELRYEHGDIATRYGTVWEINIPGIQNDPTIGSYIVHLRTPPTFQAIAFTKPLPFSGNTWVKEQLIGGGINATYGSSQEFTAQLTYELENDKLSKALYDIALPPDTAFQKVHITSIEPKPTSNTIDEDGNWIASFELAGGQKLSVVTHLLITTYIKKRGDYSTPEVLPTEYLKQLPYWESDDPLIQEIAKKYKTPREIFQFVVSALSYNYSRTENASGRKGSKEALKKPADSICTEFTDLFVAVSRAAGIPAREAVGYAYTTNQKLRPPSGVSDVLHAWPEYYDTELKLWIPVDPTWTKTTKGIDYFDMLDFNHIVFVYHGLSSDYPYPAGSFKQGSAPKKNVLIAFSESQPDNVDQSIKTTLTIPSEVTLGSYLTGTIDIQNTAGVTAEEIRVTVRAEPFVFTTDKIERNVVPYGTIKIPLAIKTFGLITTKKGTITVTVNGEITTHTFDIKPNYFLIFGIVALITSITLFIWILFKRR